MGGDRARGDGPRQGVEDPRHCRRSRDQGRAPVPPEEGCQEIQGYLVGRPAPIASYADITNGDVSTRLAG